MSEQQESAGFDLNAVIEDAKKVITNPVEFYRNMPVTGGLTNPIIFVAGIGILCGLLIAILSLFGLGRVSMGGAITAGFTAIIFFPIFAVIGSFIAAAILFVVWRLMGSDKNYEAAFRSAAFAWAIAPICMILATIPYLGGIIQTLWSMFLGYTSSVEVGKVKDQTAKIVFGILAALLVISGIQTERTVNKWSAKAKHFERELKNSDVSETIRKLEEGEEISAEDAGKMAGEFLKSLESFGKGLEEATKAEEPAEDDN